MSRRVGALTAIIPGRSRPAATATAAAPAARPVLRGASGCAPLPQLEPAGTPLCAPGRPSRPPRSGLAPAASSAGAAGHRVREQHSGPLCAEAHRTASGVLQRRPLAEQHQPGREEPAALHPARAAAAARAGAAAPHRGRMGPLFCPFRSPQLQKAPKPLPTADLERLRCAPRVALLLFRCGGVPSLQQAAQRWLVSSQMRSTTSGFGTPAPTAGRRGAGQ